MPNIPEAVDRHAGRGEHRRDLVVVLAGLRRERRARSVRPDRAEGAVLRRRLPVRREGDRLSRAGARDRRARFRRSSASWSFRTCSERPDARRDPRRGRVGRLRIREPRGRRRRSEFEHLPFDHPLYIMYSSGTTGLPKCMVHGAGGTLLQHLKELVLHTDLDARRPHLLLHHLRVDDVELARVEPRRRRDASCSTTARRSSPPRRSSGTWPRGADHRVRHERQVARARREGRARAGAYARPLARSRPSSRPAARSPPPASTTSTRT